jgi:DNA-binding GntR family transcriptional regulator
MHCRACHCIAGLGSALLSPSMAVNWDDFEARREATPVYVQLANFIEAAINSGDLAPGAQIPAERRLAELVGIAAETAGNAKRLLADRGLVETGHGTGTFVKARD